MNKEFDKEAAVEINSDASILKHQYLVSTHKTDVIEKLAKEPTAKKKKIEKLETPFEPLFKSVMSTLEAHREIIENQNQRCYLITFAKKQSPEFNSWTMSRQFSCLQKISKIFEEEQREASKE